MYLPRPFLPTVLHALGLALGLALAPADATQNGQTGQAGYLKIHPDFVVNLKSSDGRDRFLLATIEVMSRDPRTLELAGNHLPAMRHNLLMLLGDQSYPDIGTPQAQAALQSEALAVVNEVVTRELGEDRSLEGLYFTNFVIE